MQRSAAPPLLPSLPNPTSSPRTLQVPSATHPLAQDCFKLLAGMLRDCDAYKPTVAQLRFLLRWTAVDMEDSAEVQTGFALLRAILGRRVVVPEVYDVMARWAAGEGEGRGGAGGVLAGGVQLGASHVSAWVMWRVVRCGSGE
jgi:U3 small nucleolar RNA-associated protein 20